jgi:hypothetical protein
MADRAFLQRLERELVDQGKLIEAGWVLLRRAAIHPDAPAEQLTEMRMAFFAGAQHLFAALMDILEPGEEPTEADLKRMNMINDELGAFLEKMKLRIAQPKGSG